MKQNSVDIRVCMGTGGIASGGTEVLAAFKQELSSAGVKASVRENCATHQVGCRGLCAPDVLVDVAVGDDRTTYQYIKADMVPRIVQEHVLGNQPVAEWRVGEEYQKFHEKQVKVVLADCGRIDPQDIEAYRGLAWRGGALPAVMLAIFLFSLGTQFLFMGLIEEMLVRTYHESQGKPIYMIKRTMEQSKTDEQDREIHRNR